MTSRYGPVRRPQTPDSLGRSPRPCPRSSQPLGRPPSSGSAMERPSFFTERLQACGNLELFWLPRRRRSRARNPAPNHTGAARPQHPPSPPAPLHPGASRALGAHSPASFPLRTRGPARHWECTAETQRWCAWLGHDWLPPAPAAPRRPLKAEGEGPQG